MRKPYCSIQTAIDNAVDTDEIVVAPGTYFENINFLGKAIQIRSSGGAAVTIIDAQGGTVVSCVSGEGLDTVLKGGVLRDLDGNPRFVADACAGESGATVDMGAYEFQGTSCDLSNVMQVQVAWGTCGDCDSCRHDFDSDCSVGIYDLLILLANGR